MKKIKWFIKSYMYFVNFFQNVLIRNGTNLIGIIQQDYTIRGMSYRMEKVNYYTNFSEGVGNVAINHRVTLPSYLIRWFMTHAWMKFNWECNNITDVLFGFNPKRSTNDVFPSHGNISEAKGEKLNCWSIDYTQTFWRCEWHIFMKHISILVV